MKPSVKEIGTALRAMVVLTLALGLLYPLAMTGVSQVLFPNKADGSQVKVGGRVVGSRLIGLPVVIATGRKDADGNAVTRPNPRYFQPRPSATGYSPSATFFGNAGPNQGTTRDATKQRLDDYLALERPFDPSLTAAKVPVDAVTTSASGVDPQISQTNAGIQARRVAATRKLDLARVLKLVEDNTDGRFLGLLGEPGVNITDVNLALDR
jgi:K+-transporting ATPase ATPase C chain